MGETSTTQQSDDNGFTGPRVTRTPEAEAAVRIRYQRAVQHAADRRFRDAVQRWAADDDLGFPDYDQTVASVAAEVDTVCRALGPWAAVDPVFIFPAPPIPRLMIVQPPDDGWEDDDEE